MKAARCKSILVIGLGLDRGGVRGENRGVWGRGGEKREGEKDMGRMVETVLWSTLGQNRVTDGSSSVVLHLKKVEKNRSYITTQTKKTLRNSCLLFPLQTESFLPQI